MSNVCLNGAAVEWISQVRIAFNFVGEQRSLGNLHVKGFFSRSRATKDSSYGLHLYWVANRCSGTYIALVSWALSWRRNEPMTLAYRGLQHNESCQREVWPSCILHVSTPPVL